MVYRTKGTCSQAINVEAENGIVTKVQFVGGCAGNTAGIATDWKAPPAARARPHVRISWQKL